MFATEIQEIKAVVSTNSGRHLLMHLFSSLVHAILSFLLMFEWSNSRYCGDLQTAVSITFGILTGVYCGGFAVQFTLAIRHYWIRANSQRAIAITTNATSGSSVALACAGMVTIELLMRDIGTSCTDSALYIWTLIFLGVSINFNALLFVISVIHWKYLKQFEKSLNEYTKNAAIRRHALGQIKQAVNEPAPSYCSTTIPPASFIHTMDVINTPKQRTTEAPTPLYPSDQLSEISSFDGLTNLHEKCANA